MVLRDVVATPRGGHRAALGQNLRMVVSCSGAVKCRWFTSLVGAGHLATKLGPCVELPTSRERGA